MRKLTIIITFGILCLSLVSKGQSTTINTFTLDTANISGDCLDTTHQVDFKVTGTSKGRANTVAIKADFDNGNGLQTQAKVRADTFRNYSHTFSHNFKDSGTYNVEVVVDENGGGSDTSNLNVTIANSCTKIKGKSYLDQSNNCQKSTSEPGLNNVSIKLLDNNGNLVGLTTSDDNGNYMFNVTKGQNYTVKAKKTSYYNINCPSSGKISVNNLPANNSDFGFNCDSSNDFKFASAYLSTGNFRVSMERKFNFSLNGTMHCSSDSLSCIKAILDKDLRTHDSFYSNSNNSPEFSSYNGDTVKWDLKSTNLDSFSNASFPIYTKSSASINDTLCVKIILCTNDINQKNDTVKKCYQVINSYDPNNKVVEPKGKTKKGYIGQNQTLTYTINFQNTGNAKAFDVRVEDTLDKDLDPSSISIVSKSHPMDLEIVNNQILKFKFNNINLPDSGTNEPASHGHVKYKIDPDKSIGKGVAIKNSAAIFFDQNKPIITNETVNTTCEPSRDTLKTKVCNSFVSPSGNNTWTQSGIYHDTLTDSKSCDSIIKIDLTVNKETSAKISEKTCNSYKVPSGDETYTKSGTYYDTLKNGVQCDSVITIDLTIKEPTNSSIQRSVCNSYTVPSGDETYTKSGNYYDTLTNSAKCDSVIFIDLTVNKSSFESISETACQSYTVPSGNETYTQSGTYYDTLTNSTQCDSVLQISLTIDQPVSSTIDKTKCESYTLPSGDETYTTEGTYYDTLSTVGGCDSTLTINLDIVSNKVTKNNKTLKSEEDGANYQWLNCDKGYQPINGATSQTFTPKVSGNYAVEVEESNCSDTSQCYNVKAVGLKAASKTHFTINPNPASELLTVNWDRNEIDPGKIHILNSTGKKVELRNIKGKSELQLELNDYEQGIYFIQILKDGKIIGSQKFIKH